MAIRGGVCLKRALREEQTRREPENTKNPDASPRS
jgi:hypothetical protein